MLAASLVRPAVAGYSGYRQIGGPNSTHRGLPSPYLTFIITLDDPLVMAQHVDPRQGPGNYDTLVGGLHTGPALISYPGRQSGVQLRVDPLWCQALFGVPAGELSSIDLSADVLLGPLAQRWQDQIRHRSGWSQRFAVLDELLATRLGDAFSSIGTRPSPPPGIAPEVQRAWAVLRRRQGKVRIDELAAEVGWSTRHLSHRFAQQVGLTPKAAARVVRFDRARRMLQSHAFDGRPGETAAVAATAGYFDQAHFAREFRQLAGASASAWLASEFANVQAGSADLGDAG
ncbi:MAG: Transcriptional regulator, AraC family [Frankiales bacterium]|nr:Transcriptional regulator, AraC family [Frankiales bacterium]